MDWYVSMEEYTRSKQNMFAHQKPEDVAIYLEGNAASQQIASVSPGHKIPFFAPPGAHVEDNIIKIDGQNICSTDELKLLGRHNWQNICAAVTAAWQVTQNVEAYRSVLTNFSGLEYRLEFVRELDGVKYYNDSFGTTPETAIVAIQAFTEPKIIILGGSDKGSNYSELARVVATSNVRCAVLIGAMGPKIMRALEAAEFHNFTDGGKLMTDIVKAARQQAKPGDVVLLSTACASYDMFHDYKDRGDQFKQVVRALV
jgi:UDP-N-acetylmuramoylalanine--D-glutamate ligase